MDVHAFVISVIPCFLTFYSVGVYTSQILFFISYFTHFVSNNLSVSGSAIRMGAGRASHCRGVPV